MVVSRGMLAGPCKSARKCARMQGIPAGYVFLVTIKNLILLLRSHIFFVLRWSRGPHDGWCVHIGVIFFRVGSILTQCNYTVTTYSFHQKSHITVALIYIFCVSLVAWSAIIIIIVARNFCLVLVWLRGLQIWFQLFCRVIFFRTGSILSCRFFFSFFIPIKKMHW